MSRIVRDIMNADLKIVAPEMRLSEVPGRFTALRITKVVSQPPCHVHL